jgi:class 3 adenylate cyclase/tetratricopeptide (TPR) repeat protein
MATCQACGHSNREAARFCEACAAPLGGTERGEERKLATMLFADLAASTELGSTLDPERLRSLLQRYFAAVAGCIDTWGGTVEKYIGDAVLAVFGVPTAREDDAERAVCTALEIVQRLEELNPGFERHYGVTLRVRVGVNTGEVIAPASDDVSQAIVAGDAVNVAARLEQAARPGSVLVGRRTYAATRRAFRFDGPIALTLKGKEGTVDAYRVLGRQAGMEGMRAPVGLTTGLVGRGREIDALTMSLREAAATNEVRTVFLRGPAGIGKSRLVQEFVNLAARVEPDLTVYRGRCLAAGRGITYWALGEILRSAFGIALDDPPKVAGDKLRDGVRRALAHLNTTWDEVQLTTYAVAATASLSLPESPLERMEPQEVGEHIARGWPRLVTALAARGPLALVFEDLHWADDRLLEMLQTLAVRARGPVLLVTTARPDGPDVLEGTGRIPGAVTIRLDSLSDAESRELVAGLLPGAELPSGLRDEILGRAEGNPLFLEELVGRLIDEGALVRKGDRWVAVPDAGLAVLPDTVHAVVSARLDSLPQDERRAIQEAAVVGRSFWAEPVARALPRIGVGHCLSELERKGFLRAQPASVFAGQVELRFRHALIRDVAYESLSRARRARSHAEVAAWMTGVAGERAEEVAELVAHHYSAAVVGDADLAWIDDPDRRNAIAHSAFDALRFAGTVARRRYAVQRAVELHEQAIELAPSRAARAAALEALGDDHDAAVHGDAALSAYREAISLLRGEPAADDDRGRICMKAARMILEKSGAFSAVKEPELIDGLVNEGLACASDPEILAWLRALWGATAVWWVNAGAELSSLDERVEWLSTSLVGGRAASLPELEAFAQEYLCEVHMARGAYGEVAALSRRTGVFDKMASPAARSLGLVETAIWARDVAGDPERALALGMRAYELARGLSPHDLMHATGFVIPALYQLGRWSELDAVLEEHVAAFADEDDATCELLHGGILAGATCFAESGDVARARELADMAPPFASTDPLWAGYADGWRARLGVAAGDVCGGLEQARAVFASAPAWPRLHAAVIVIDALSAACDHDGLADFLPVGRELDGGLALLPPTCDRAEGDVAAARGDTAAARRLWTGALEGFERLGVPFEAARTKERLAAASPGDVAAALLENALATYEWMRAARSAERVRAALR